MPLPPVIINNSPLSSLWNIGQLNLVHQLYGDVLIPYAVFEEFVAISQSQRLQTISTSAWLQVVHLANPLHAISYSNLDQGEAEVLALAVERSARLIIMDELKGRRQAKRLGLPLTGTLGILISAKRIGLIPTVQPLLSELQANGLYLSESLVARVLKQVQE